MTEQVILTLEEGHTTSIVEIAGGEQVVLTLSDVTTGSAVESADLLVVSEPAGDHGHLTGLADDDHPQYLTYTISADPPVNPRPGTVWIPPS